MKIVCTKNNLKDAFQLAERFTGRNLSLPILGSILFEADDKTARCAATNLEMGVEITIPGKVVRSGAAAIPGRIIHSLVQSIDEDTVVIEEKDGTITIKTDTSNFSLQGISPKDFPQLPRIKKELEFTVPSKELRHGLAQVLPAVSISDFKPELSGVYIKRDAKNFVLAATDSFRLAEKTTALPQIDKGGACIVPSRVCQELSRIVPDSDESVVIREGEHQIMFSFSDINVVSRLIDGAYPDYVSIIPRDFATHISVHREEVTRKVKAASLLSSKLNDVVLNCSEQGTFLEAANAELGKSQVRLQAKVKGKSGRVSFNFRYLSDGLEAMSGEDVLISLNGDSSPALIFDPQDASFRYVLMPIRNV